MAKSSDESNDSYITEDEECSTSETYLTEDEESSTSEYEIKNKYIDKLIRRILDKYPDLSKKCIYRLLTRNCAFYYNETAEMEDDPLWQKIIDNAKNIALDNEDTGMSKAASFKASMREHKPTILEMISVYFDDDSSNSDMIINEDEDAEDNLTKPGGTLGHNFNKISSSIFKR